MGFTRCGIAASNAPPAGENYFEEMIGEGFHAGMGYLARNIHGRFSPDSLLPGCKSVIVCLYHYKTATEMTGRYRVARYARLTDYHSFLKEKLEKLAADIHSGRPDMDYRITVDSSPLTEKNWAVKAGLGSIGKNSLFRSKEGSFCLIGTILTQWELEPDTEEPVECGECTLCMDACPQKAIVTPYRVDANRCLSYINTEKKNPDEGIPSCSPWIFGCDICQEVCPHNRNTYENPDVMNHFSLFLHFQDKDFEMLTAEQFDLYFKGTPLERRKFGRVYQEIQRVKKLLENSSADITEKS